MQVRGCNIGLGDESDRNLHAVRIPFTIPYQFYSAVHGRCSVSKDRSSTLGVDNRSAYSSEFDLTNNSYLCGDLNLLEVCID